MIFFHVFFRIVFFLVHDVIWIKWYTIFIQSEEMICCHSFRKFQLIFNLYRRLCELSELLNVLSYINFHLKICMNIQFHRYSHLKYQFVCKYMKKITMENLDGFWTDFVLISWTSQYKGPQITTINGKWTMTTYTKEMMKNLTLYFLFCFNNGKFFSSMRFFLLSVLEEFCCLLEIATIRLRINFILIYFIEQIKTTHFVTKWEDLFLNDLFECFLLKSVFLGTSCNLN